MEIHSDCWIWIFDEATFCELAQKGRLSNGTVSNENYPELVR